MQRTVQPYLASKKHVIWDWNGTLLNDVDLAVSAIGRLLTDNDLRVISRDDYLEIFGFPIVDYYQRLGFDFSKVPFAHLAEQFICYYDEGFAAASLHTGVAELLKDVKALGLTQSVLSAAKETALRLQLAQFGVDDHLDHIYGLTDNFALSKVGRGKQLMAAAGIEPAATILIGDTDHDLDVGRELGVDVLLLADGH